MFLSGLHVKVVVVFSWLMTELKVVSNWVISEYINFVLLAIFGVVRLVEVVVFFGAGSYGLLG